MLSLKYNEVLSKIKEIEENKNIIYEIGHNTNLINLIKMIYPS